MLPAIFGPIRQWGFLVRDIDAAMHAWIDQLGVGPWRGYRRVPMKSRFRGVSADIAIDVGFAYQNGVQIELIQQLDDAVSPYSDFRASGLTQQLHQIAYCVPDLRVAETRALEAGLRVQGEMTSVFGQRYLYLDSPALAGLVVELMPSDPTFEASYGEGLREAATWDGSNPIHLIDFATLLPQR